MSETERPTALRHDPPDVPGYRAHVREAIPLKRLSYWSLISVVPWAVLFVALGLVVTPSAEIEFAFSFVSILLALFILLILMPVLHEAVHGIVAKMVGAKPFYGIGVGFAYTSFREPVKPRQYWAISVAPLILLSLFSIAAFAFVPEWFVYIVIFATGNATGAIGDLWIVYRTRSLPPDALIYDLADGYAAFVPANEGHSTSLKA